MPHATQERPTVAPVRAARRGGSTALRLGGAALVAVLAVVGADRVGDALPGWGDLGKEVVTDRQRPALQLALGDLAEHHAAEGTYQVVVDLERRSPYLPRFLKGERTTYLAVGTVDGVVDFSALGADGVEVSGRAVTITVPAPTLGDVALDLEQSRVLARERGAVDRLAGVVSDRPTSERDVALLAEEKLARAAAESDLLRRAQDNTQDLLTGLAGSFGYEDVTVRFEPAPGT